MDSSTDEEEEFFETLEAITSSSGEENGGEENPLLRVRQHAMDIVLNAFYSPSSKYEVWKNSPGSIVERRQCLLSRMGLRVEREDSENMVVLVDTTPADLFSALSSNLETIDRNHTNANCTEQRVSRRKATHNGQVDSVASAGHSMIRSRSDGTFFRLQNNNGAENSSLWLVRSGTISPVPHHSGQERLCNSNGAVSCGRFGQSTKPTLGEKRGLDGTFSDRTSEKLPKDDRLSTWSNGTDVNSMNGEALCRIKDLDSGKEFVVNEVGEDGMWNKLKELDTGREITLEEFESSLGLSPIVQEVMRRERAASDIHAAAIQLDAGSGAPKKKKGWFKAITGVVRGSRERGNQSYHGSDSDREDSTEKFGRKSGSSIDNIQIVSPAARPVKVHAHRKAVKEFADLHLRQEIQAHQGAIWTMKFSPDGSYLATAGQDRVVRVWEVFVRDAWSTDSPNTIGERNPGSEKLILQRHGVSKKNNKCMSGRKTGTSPLSKLFMLSKNARCVFKGHTEDVLDLSWAPSQVLLSSSMDKTVRLWNISSKVCLKIFAHNDYVTCIQFHPLDDGHFISGSLDGKVRIWSIQEPKVVDWVDLQEMVTAACYTPNGQGAVVGSYKGTCRLYKMSGNKLQLDTTFEVRSNKTKRSQGKKITGFQFVPGDEEKLLITSSDSRIRVYNGTEISSKFKGFRNSKSHISASFSSNGRFIICASEDSRVCIWNYRDPRTEYLGPKNRLSGCYEDFSAKHVLVAIPWPGMCYQPTTVEKLETSPARKYSPNNHSEAEAVIMGEASSHRSLGSDDTSNSGGTENTEELGGLCLRDDAQNADVSGYGEKVSSLAPLIADAKRENFCGNFILSSCVSAQHVANNGFFSDSKGSATWPEEKLPAVPQNLSRSAVKPLLNKIVTSVEKIESTDVTAMASAWGLVIVTAGLGGEIRTFQNYSLPVRL